MSLLARRIGQLIDRPASTAALTYAEEVDALAPDRYWRLGESSGTTATDETGNADGTYVNTPTLGQTGALTGDADTAVGFTQANSEQVTVGSSVLSGQSTWTMAAWFKTSYTGGTSPYILTEGSSSSNDHLVAIYVAQATDQVGVWQKDGTTNLFKEDAGPTVNDGNWHFLVGVRSGDNIDCYLDGEHQWQITQASFGTSTMDQAGIGSLRRTTDTNYFDGDIDEAAIWAGTALTETQIRRLYYRGLGYTGYALEALSLGPARYWRLGESSGTTATDETGNGNGTYTNSPTLAVAGLLAGDDDTAVDFDGTNDYVDTGWNGPSGSHTVTFWVDLDVTTACHIWSNHSHASGEHVIVGVNGTSKFYSFWDDGTNDPGAVGTTTVSTGTTYFIAATFDDSDGTTKIYVNGTLETTAVLGAWNGYDPGQTCYIARRRSATGNEMNGTLDEVAVYEKILTATEISDLYTAGT